ncbi:hypothetical protein [Leifsonia sp. Leaf264]|uniref:hypothetical protein n=1 Tax=Leifsonia sp. Leaf264 TaxID=1736314 RepID=UPI0006F558A4|nr:hypothetical protein [Leifsonia sp. Leaf264]KQP01680.1 hypothetical protein ASF30_03625 [Leifsonia sp. Leaf264]
MVHETRLPAVMAVAFVVGVGICALLFGVPTADATPGPDPEAAGTAVAVAATGAGTADSLERFVIRHGGVEVRATVPVDRRGAHPAPKRLPRPLAQR